MNSPSAQRRKDTKKKRDQRSKDSNDSGDFSIPEPGTNESQSASSVLQHVEALKTANSASLLSSAESGLASVETAATAERHLVRYLDETIQSCDNLYTSCLSGIQHTLHALRAEVASRPYDQVQASRLMARSRTLSSDIVPLLDLHNRLRSLCQDIQIYHESLNLRTPEVTRQSTVDTQSATHSPRPSQAHQAWSEYTAATRDVEQSSSDDGSLPAERSDHQGRVLGTCVMIAKLLSEKGDLEHATQMRDFCESLERRQKQAAIATSRQQQQSIRNAEESQQLGSTNPIEAPSEGNFEGFDLDSIQAVIELMAGSETS